MSAISLSTINNTPPKQLGGITPNFTGMILGRSPLEVVQRFPFWLPWQLKRKTFKNLLVKNYWADLKFCTKGPWVTLYQDCTSYID